MSRKQSLNKFIACLARKIAIIYPSNYADEDDYIQVGHLTLAEIRQDRHEHDNFHAYAIVAVANTMRNAALDAMCAASAPRRVKKQVHQIEMLLAAGKTERVICNEIDITPTTLATLRPMIHSKSWHMLFGEPTQDSEPFSVLDDLLSSGDLTEEDKMFIRARVEGTDDDLGLSRWGRHAKAKNLRSKLARSGYGI